jgi:hypothetical protein
MDWFHQAVHPLFAYAKWTWQKSGEHYGPTAQLGLILLVGAIFYNLFRRR